jgi:hypothetical protein
MMTKNNLTNLALKKMMQLESSMKERLRNLLKSKLVKRLNRMSLLVTSILGSHVTDVKSQLMVASTVLTAILVITFAIVSAATSVTRNICTNLTDKKFLTQINLQKTLRI